MTAVEWLVSEMLKPNLSMKDIVEQAKEIEKKQIIDARNNMQKKCIKLSNSIIGGIFLFDEEEAEKYYNETFNK